MKDTHERNVRTIKEFKKVYFPRLTAEQSSDQSVTDLSYVRQLVSKSLKHNKQ